MGPFFPPDITRLDLIGQRLLMKMLYKDKNSEEISNKKLEENVTLLPNGTPISMTHYKSLGTSSTWSNSNQSTYKEKKPTEQKY